MKISVLAAGTLGDVQPYVALGVALQRAGYAVQLVSNSNFEPLARTWGLGFAPLGVDSQAFAASPGGQAFLEAPSLPALLRHSLREIRPALAKIVGEAWEATEDADAIVYHAYTLPTGQLIAKQRGVPAIPASIYPVPTRAHPVPGVSVPSIPGLGGTRAEGALNLATHLVQDQLTWLVYRSSARAIANGRVHAPLVSPTYGLRRQNAPMLCCYSPSVLPPPSDLPSGVHVTGYWFLEPPPGWEPDRRLLAFLEAGPPPVYVGFGSMGNPARAQETTRLVLAALEEAGQRGLLAAGWSGLGGEIAARDDVLCLESAPHAWLFPRTAAVVHHGGVGTTGAALAAGVPSVVVPHFGDQPFWAQRVEALRVGPPAIPRRELTSRSLALAISAAVGDQTLRKRAQELGARIGSERGTAEALAVIRGVVGPST